MDGNECGDDGARICKILYIHNTEKVSPFRVRRFVSALKKLLLEGVGYDFAYGHAADLLCSLEPTETDAPATPPDARPAEADAPAAEAKADDDDDDSWAEFY